MMKRLIAVTAFGAGYVAGSAAGRERYEQIRALALRVKDDAVGVTPDPFATSVP